MVSLDARRVTDSRASIAAGAERAGIESTEDTARRDSLCTAKTLELLKTSEVAIEYVEESDSDEGYAADLC